MYKKILVPLDNSKTDQAILRHIRPLAKMTGAALVFVHVAEGYAARFQEQLNLQDSQEIKEDQTYLESRQKEFNKEGFMTKIHLVRGEPAKEILKLAQKEKCDLIAMSTHGHRFIKDIILGSVAENLRHRTDIPILMIRAIK